MSNKNSILLIDPSFDPNSAGSCSLLIRLGIDSISYAIINKYNNKICAIFDEQGCDDSSEKFGERLKSDDYLALPFQEIKLAVFTENYLSVPNVIFNVAEIPSNTKYFSQPPVGNTYTNDHVHFGFTSVFSLSKVTDQMINYSLASSKKYELNALLLKLAEHTDSTSLIFDFTSGSFQVLYKLEDQIIFQKRYETENVEEFNYYILLIVDKLGINIEEISVYLTGIIHSDDKKFNCISKYFKTIKFLDFKNTHLDAEILEDMPLHYYTSLLALDQCE